MVHLFEWKWTDIAAECERYLGPKEFCAVQVSPPMEHAIITSDATRPWWERYQPVSYKLVSRSGNEAQFKDMVTRCKNVGVRIIVDAVINHMVGTGRKGTGTAGSYYDSDARDFPGVPYSRQNFHDRSSCPSHNGGVNNYGDPNNVRNCNLSGLTDLDGGQDYVRDKIAGYLNHLIALAWPASGWTLQNTCGQTNDLPEGGRPFFVLEVIDRNDGAIKVNEYFNLGYVTELRYIQKVREGANDLGRLGAVYDPGWGMAPSEHAFIFVDNHDTQRGSEALTYKYGDEYKRAVAFTLANDYGFTRVMSSYYFNDFNEGPPHNGDYSTKDVNIKSDGSCDNGWVCEHRWSMIGNMVRFRNAVAGTHVENFKYENGVLSLNRGDKGFFAMGKNDFNVNVYTGLAAGEYCDLISECAMKVTVDASGRAQVKPHDPSQPYVAIVAGGGTNNNFPVTPSGSQPGTIATTNNPGNTINPGTTQAPYVPSGEEDYKRTVIIFERNTQPGQDLFIRGGIDHVHRPGCSGVAPPNPCSIPIKHVNVGTSNHYDKVNAWSMGDNYLDWGGAEGSQGSYHGQPAEGTPAVWTSNDVTHPGYNELNQYNDHYWIVDVEMDCSMTENGFFEVKAVVSGAWEGDIPGQHTCTGSGATTPPYSSKNHFARCGYLNVFHFNQDACEIEII